jgi:hypothetical protein
MGNPDIKPEGKIGALEIMYQNILFCLETNLLEKPVYMVYMDSPSLTAAQKVQALYRDLEAFNDLRQQIVEAMSQLSTLN